MRPAEISRLIEQRLAELREHPELLTRWDLNRDGELDEREWDLVRRMVEHEVETAQKRGESPSAEFEPEILNDRYEVVGLLGRGGQAETFLALDRENDNQHVVAKVLEIKVAADWKSIELFEREAKVLERLEHPRIPAYIDHFHLDGAHATRFVIIQQFIDGEDLGKLVESGKTWTAAQAMARLGELAEILTYLHELGPPVVHRDIKPSNIIHGRDDHLYLVDFGAAQNIVPATVGGSTIIGTSGYVPMEQYMGRASPASDIYGLGATFVHLLSGKHPADMDLDRGRLRFEKYVQDAELVALLKSMLAHLEDRVPSGAALEKALADEHFEPIPAPPAPPAELTIVEPSESGLARRVRPSSVVVTTQAGQLRVTSRVRQPQRFLDATRIVGGGIILLTFALFAPLFGVWPTLGVGIALAFIIGRATDTSRIPRLELDSHRWQIHGARGWRQPGVSWLLGETLFAGTTADIVAIAVRERVLEIETRSGDIALLRLPPLTDGEQRWLNDEIARGLDSILNS